ncbi:MCP four helix bundle domain-containing protein, partial [Sporotomaculum syntrophicum]|uniref:MCP four helix bundle domain-containing protein n=1 Tax=Sporotomaculum syntrophicum TaxID=182264 RepID=UPI001379F611
MKLRNKLYIDFGLFLILIIIIAITSLYVISQFKNNMNEVVQNNYEEVRLANIVRYEISSTSRYLRDLILLDMDEASIEKDIQNVEDSRRNTLFALNDMDKLMKLNETSKLVSRVKVLYSNFNDVQIEIATLIKEGRKDDAAELLASVQKNRDEIYQVINQIVEIEEQAMQDALKQAETSYQQAIGVFTTLIILGVLIGLGVMFISMHKITGDINTVTGVLNSITSFDATNNLPRINIAANNEIGQIAHAFNEMAGVLEKRIKQEKEYHKEIQEQSWLKSSVGEVSTMFQGVKNIEIFCNELITKITPMVGGKYGVIYLLEGGEEDRKYLKKLAAYAFDGSQIDSPDFKLGEGL